MERDKYSVQISIIEEAQKVGAAFIAEDKGDEISGTVILEHVVPKTYSLQQQIELLRQAAREFGILPDPLWLEGDLELSEGERITRILSVKNVLAKFIRQHNPAIRRLEAEREKRMDDYMEEQGFERDYGN